MKSLFTIFISLFFIQANAQLSSLPEKMCDVYGKIYYTYSELDADYKVYFEKADVLGDYKIYKEENELFAISSGIWHEVYDLRYADYKIYIVKDKFQADFSVFVTDIKSEAGCKKDE